MHRPLLGDQKPILSIDHLPLGIICIRGKGTRAKVIEKWAKLMELEEVTRANKRELPCIHTGRGVGLGIVAKYKITVAEY